MAGDLFHHISEAGLEGRTARTGKSHVTRSSSQREIVKLQGYISTKPSRSFRIKRKTCYEKGNLVWGKIILSKQLRLRNSRFVNFQRKLGRLNYLSTSQLYNINSKLKKKTNKDPQVFLIFVEIQVNVNQQPRTKLLCFAEHGTLSFRSNY